MSRISIIQICARNDKLRRKATTNSDPDVRKRILMDIRSNAHYASLNVLEFSPTQIDKLTTSMGSLDQDISPLQTSQYIEYKEYMELQQLAHNL